MPHPYPLRLQALFAENADSVTAEPMKKYMKNHFEYFGIKSPLRRSLSRQFLQAEQRPSMEEIPQVIRELWAMPQREIHYFAIDFLAKYRKEWDPDIMSLFEFMITTHSWWDSVDAISTELAGAFFTRFPELMHSRSTAWIESDNMWLQRTAIIFQRRYKDKTDEALLFSHIRRRADETDFFIRKAIGWALREYAKTKPEAVQAFVDETPLSPLSVREALKHF